MMLRSSISNTKKFFQKTIENFKSFFSSGYQKLPKNPNTSNLTFYNNLHESQNNPTTKIVVPSSQSSPSPLQNHIHPKPRNPVMTHRRKDDDDTKKAQLFPRRQGKTRFPVAEKLRELETLMGLSNGDHFSDVQEFLHYYSRLHCPVYLDIVEQFFMEMYAEFLEPLTLEPPRKAVSSQQRPRVVGSCCGYQHS